MKNFNNIYEEVYKKYAKPMEEKRKKTRNLNLTLGTIIIIIGLILTGITNSFVFLYLAFIITFITIIVIGNSTKYKAFFKENIIKTFVKEYSETLEYLPTLGINSRIYDEAEFEKNYDRYYTEDLIKGTLNDKYIVAMAEVHTENESRDSDGDTTYTTIFHGLFAKVEFPKLVNANIKIRENKLIKIGKKNRIEMDSSEFEKKFDVYTTDKIIAMQLLTADIMQMLLDFKEKNKIIPEMTLKGNVLYIRFSTGDMFEPTLMRNALKYETLKKYYDTINFTLNITERFLKNIEETEL